MHGWQEPAGGESNALGFFAPQGAFWRVNRENVLMLGAGCTLLLQLAHPLVAAGVAEHSTFRKHPLRRLYATLRRTQQFLYGDRATALAAARGLRAVHARVRGTLKQPMSVFPAGTSYRADDPPLLLWVFATLVAASLSTYEQFRAPLDRDERSEYYARSKVLARLFGIDEEVLPRDYPAFSGYFEDMLQGPTLTVTETSACLAQAVLRPPIRLVPGFLLEWHRLITTALLPPVLRERYRLSWDEEQDGRWQAFRGRVSRALPVLPEFIRAAPGALWAEHRWKRAQRRLGASSAAAN